MQVSLDAIKFNHDPLSATVDAINIRRNETEPVTVPEWPGKSDKAEDSVAAYALSETSGNKITIQAKFHVDTRVKSIEIRAIDPAGNFILSELDELVDTVFSWLSTSPRPRARNVLGRVKSRRITFLENGDSNFETFELEDVRIGAAGVSVSTTTWQWQYRLSSQDSWINLETSRHRIYTVLKMPSDPWSHGPLEKGNVQLPWSEVLEYACSWASGARGITEAASRITLGFRNVESRLYVTYDPSPFYSHPNFDCAAFLDLLRDKLGKGRRLNCSDCATVVSSFSNILGCSLWQSTMAGTYKVFRTNPIRLFGRTCWRKVSFASHEVAWVGACTENEEVFDASMELDGDDEPTVWPHKPVLPTSMRFASHRDRQYLFRMHAPSDDMETVEARPRTRQRRKIYPSPGTASKRLSPSLRGFVRSHYKYSEWCKAPSEEGPLFPREVKRELFPRAADFPSWEFLIAPEYVETSDHPLVIRALIRTRSIEETSLIRLDIDICRSARSARYFLLQRLGQFQSPTLKWRKDLDIGEVIFTEPAEGAIVFSRANSVVLLRNAGHDTVDLRGEARRLDYGIEQFLKEPATGDSRSHD